MTATPPDTICLQSHHHENELKIISDYLEECENYAKIMQEIILCFGLNSDSKNIEKHMTLPQKKLYREILNG